MFSIRYNSCTKSWKIVKASQRVSKTKHFKNRNNWKGISLPRVIKEC